MSVLPPKRRAKASKKKKASWRKNTDLDEVEQELDEQRELERLGLKDKPDDELFQVDERDAVQVEREEAAPAKNRRRVRSVAASEARGPLKCFQHLEVKMGVADPKRGNRNRRKTDDERENPLVKKQRLDRIKEGNKRPVEIRAEKQAALLRDKKEATKSKKKDRNLQRRTKFDFDLWDDVPKTAQKSAAGGGTVPLAAALDDAGSAQLRSDEWLDKKVLQHNLKETRRLRRRVPADFHASTSDLKSVEVPHAGASYNPSYQDHQELLFSAAVVELNKEKEKQKLEFHTTSMFPTTSKAELEQNYLKEMSQGIKELEQEVKENEEEVAAEEEEASEEDEAVTPSTKLKTRKQRRKAKEAHKANWEKEQAKADKKKNQDIYRVKSMKKMLSAQERLTQARVQQRKLKAVARRSLPAQLSKNKFEPADVELKLTEELTGNLRSVQPEGNLLLDRYKSLQKRNVIETTVKQKRNKKNFAKKRYDKRSYKMQHEKLKALADKRQKKA